MEVYGYLFIISLISATLFPLGSEGVFIYDILNHHDIVYLLFFATLGNSLGSSLNYWLGLRGEEYLMKKNLIKENMYQKAKAFFERFGALTLFFSWLPIIGDGFTFVAGVFKYNFLLFIMIVTIAKFSRYFIIYLFL